MKNGKLTLTINFDLEKETRNYYRFSESGGNQVTVGPFYIHKNALPNGAPEKIQMVVQAKE